MESVAPTSTLYVAGPCAQPGQTVIVIDFHAFQCHGAGATSSILGLLRAVADNLELELGRCRVVCLDATPGVRPRLQRFINGIELRVAPENVAELARERLSTSAATESTASTDARRYAVFVGIVGATPAAVAHVSAMLAEGVTVADVSVATDAPTAAMMTVRTLGSPQCDVPLRIRSAAALPSDSSSSGEEDARRPLRSESCFEGVIRGRWTADRNGAPHNYIEVEGGRKSVFVHADQMRPRRDFDRKAALTASPGDCIHVRFAIVENGDGHVNTSDMAVDVRVLRRSAADPSATDLAADHETGVIQDFKSGRGCIVADRDGVKLFLHPEQSSPRTFLKAGKRVVFQRRTNRNPAFATQQVAFDVRDVPARTAAVTTTVDRRADLFGSWRSA